MFLFIVFPFRQTGHQRVLYHKNGCARVNSGKRCKFVDGPELSFSLYVHFTEDSERGISVEIFGKQIDKYEKLGFLIRENERVRFSHKGFFVSNTILSEFV